MFGLFKYEATLCYLNTGASEGGLCQCDAIVSEASETTGCAFGGFAVQHEVGDARSLLLLDIVAVRHGMHSCRGILCPARECPERGAAPAAEGGTHAARLANHLADSC